MALFRDEWLSVWRPTQHVGMDANPLFTAALELVSPWLVTRPGIQAAGPGRPLSSVPDW